MEDPVDLDLNLLLDPFGTIPRFVKELLNDETENLLNLGLALMKSYNVKEDLVPFCATFERDELIFFNIMIHWRLNAIGLFGELFELAAKMKVGGIVDEDFSSLLIIGSNVETFLLLSQLMVLIGMIQTLVIGSQSQLRILTLGTFTEYNLMLLELLEDILVKNKKRAMIDYVTCKVPFIWQL